MFKYVKDFVFLKQMGRDCIGHMKSFRKIINNEKRLRVDFKLIGEEPLTMTIQDGINPLEIPFYLEVFEIYDQSLNAENLKEYLMECFNKIEGSAFGNSLDSRFSIDTKYIWYTTGNNTKFKLNISIIFSKEDGIYRLTKTKDGTSYNFELMENSKDIFKKEARLKQLCLFEKVRVAYVNKKNVYLASNELEFHTPLDCYFEAINFSFKKNIKNK